MRPALIATLLAACLVLPAAAQAATFSVDDDAPPPVQCTAAVTCQDLPAAVAAARLNSEADTIVLAPGTYSRVDLTNAQDANLTIEGAGQSADPAVGSVITYGGPHGVTIGTTSAASNLTIRRLRLVNTGIVEQIDFGQGPVDVLRSFVIGLNGSGSTLEDVTVDALGDFRGDAAIDARAPNISLRRVTVRTAGTAAVYGQDAPGLRISDADIAAGAGGGQVFDVRGNTAGMRVERSRLSVAPAAERIASLDADGLVMDSVLLTGGKAGLLLFTPATLRHVTIDAAAPGVADPLVLDGEEEGGFGLMVGAQAVTLESSIVLEPLTGSGLTCTASNVGDSTTASGLPDCPNGGGNPKGNTSTPSAALFADAAGGDWRLKAGSPARDRGSLAALAIDETATDAAGQPRITDGDRDCAPRRDQGAYESTDGANTPPVLSAIGGGPGTAGQVLGLTATASDAEQSAASLAYAWTLPFGGTGSGATASLTPTTPGPFSAAVTVTDAGGCKASLQRSIDVGPDTTAPTVSRSSVTSGAAAGGRAATVRLTLSEAGTLKLRLQRLAGGKRVSGRCVAKGKGRPCTRRVTVGTATVTGTAGTNRVALLKALKRRTLAKGRYRLEVRVRDAAGNTSRLLVLTFRVKR